MPTYQSMIYTTINIGEFSAGCVEKNFWSEASNLLLFRNAAHCFAMLENRSVSKLLVGGIESTHLLMH